MTLFIPRQIISQEAFRVGRARDLSECSLLFAAHARDNKDGDPFFSCDFAGPCCKDRDRRAGLLPPFLNLGMLSHEIFRFGRERVSSERLFHRNIDLTSSCFLMVVGNCAGRTGRMLLEFLVACVCANNPGAADCSSTRLLLMLLGGIGLGLALSLMMEMSPILQSVLWLRSKLVRKDSRRGDSTFVFSP